jgi:D-3-phosphoglycerate dehydrogenase
MRLAEQLGSLAGQLLTSGIKGVTVEFHGEASTINTRPVTAAALTGLLKHALEEVNMVSAPVVAKERNIQIAEVKRDTAVDYHTLLSLTVETDTGAQTFQGTLVGNTLPRIVKLDNVSLEAELGQHMLFIRNLDKPGFIGALGGLLGDASVNIATFHLGRTAPGAEAVLLTEVDQPIPATVLEKVRKLPQVVEARALEF